ncbi:MAG: AbrB/MazE/SpoVT family DNA-binding domain-containing protein [Acidimicrobiia bacterium]
MPTTKTVKVTKSGNSRVLPVPADLARDAHVAVGDVMAVEVRGTDIIYRRDAAVALVVGEGRSRVAVVPQGRALRMPGRSVLGALDTWDF